MARSLCDSGSVRYITLLSATVEKNDRREHVVALSAKPADLPVGSRRPIRARQKTVPRQRAECADEVID